MSDLLDLPFHEARQQATPAEYVEASLRAIAARNAELNLFLHVSDAAEGALPVAIKDNIMVAGVPMMNGASTLKGYTPDVDATVVTRLLDAAHLLDTGAHDLDCLLEHFLIGAGAGVSFYQAKRIADELIQNGTASHASLGVQVGNDASADGAKIVDVAEFLRHPLGWAVVVVKSVNAPPRVGVWP